MPPKKAAAKGGAKTEGPLNGIIEEGCTLPLWDENEIASENWGGDLAAVQVDASQQFVDNDFPSGLENCFSTVIHGWKRPTSIFSPFKPMVYRSLFPQFGNPYTFNIATADKDLLEVGDEHIETQADVIALYRRMRCIVVPNPTTDGANNSPSSPTTPGTAEGGAESPTRRRVRRRQYKGDPSFMRAFNSALLVLAQNQGAVSQGRYAWELIYPQAASTGFPVYNMWGKYVVKLFYRGAYRKIVVDDRLPVDSNADSILSVTDQKEIWPALILKALFKVLGPLHERRVLEDPIFILSCLLGGSMPERIPTGLKEMRLADVFRKHAANPTRNVLAATVKQQTKGEGLGLEPKQLYNVIESRPFQNTVALRLCGHAAQWKGKLAYGSPSWTSEVEDILGFDPNIHRNKHELSKQWNDFWVTWEDFVEEFEFVYLMHPVIQDPIAYGNFRQVLAADASPTGPTAPTKPPRETPRNATNAVSPLAADPFAPTIKWLLFKPNQSAISDMLMVFLGLGRPLPVPHPTQIGRGGVGGGGGIAPPVGFISGTGPSSATDPAPFSVTVDRYQWRDSGPFSSIIKYTGPWDPYAALPFIVPQSSEPLLYRVMVRGMPPEAAISFIGSTEFTIGDEKDMLKEVGIYTVTDAGKYAAHEPGISTIWFKRWLSVKTPTIANFALKTLPRQTDITPFKMTLVDSTQPKTKGGAAAKGVGAVGVKGKDGASGQTPHPPSIPQSPIPLEEEAQELAVIDDVSLCLLDLDSGNIVKKDSLSQILGAELQPNKLGYVLTASAAPENAKAAGLWKLRITSNAPLETIEQRSTEEMHVKTGNYHYNTSSTLFKYTITAAELTTASLQVSLYGAPPGVAFLVQVLHGDKELKKMAVGRCFISHLTFPPPDKNTPNVFKLIGTLERDFADAQEEKRVAAVAERLEADVAAQTALAEELKEQLIEKWEETGEMPTLNALENSPQQVTDLPTPTKGVTFSLPSQTNGNATGAATPLPTSSPSSMVAPAVLLDAASKLSTALNEANDSFGISFEVRIHASSARLDVHEDTTAADQIAAAAVAWAKRDQPEGSPVPKGKQNTKNNQAALEETNARATKAREARLRYLANPTSVFIPFTYNGTIYTEPTDGPSSYRVAPAASIKAADLMSQREAAAAEVASKTAALPATTQPGTPQHKTALTAILSKVEERLAEQSRQRKEFFTGANNLLMGAFDIKPQTTEPDDDRKKKKR